MTKWDPHPLPTSGPLYRRIADALARDVEDGTLTPRTRLPTHRSLAKELGVNVMTVTRAYAEASRRGLLEARVGRGSFVRGPRDATDRPVDRPFGVSDARIDLAFNLPAGECPFEAPDALSAISADRLACLLDRGYATVGLPEHRTTGVHWLARAGVKTTQDRILVTAGAQHAMTVAFATLLRPGDALLTESATYAGTRAVAEILGLRPVGVKVDADGLVPDDLERVVVDSGARVLYIQPTISNPTGTVQPEDRRREVVAICRRHDVRVVEDDSYGFLHRAPPPPIAALAPERTFYLTSLSKSLASGLRVGWLSVPETRNTEALVTRAAGHVAALAWAASPLTAELATRFIDDGTADARVSTKRRETTARQKLARTVLGELGDSDPASCHIWYPLPAPWRADDFVAQAALRDVVVSAPGPFCVDPNARPNRVRICLGTPATRAEVKEGLEVLAMLLDDTPRSLGPIV